MSGAPSGVIVAAIRSAAPRALAVLVRRTGDLQDAEDAIQEALAEASARWAVDGLPREPVAWLVTVAKRRWIDALRSEDARRQRELRTALLEIDTPEVVGRDDTLALYLLCCHPVLSRGARIALTLRAVGGLTTAEIARGLALSETATGQRISRAKSALRRAGADRGLGPIRPDELPGRIEAVLDVIGLIHTESHSAASGEEISRPTLATDALRLARQLLAVSPGSAPWRGEVEGLLALILLTEARAPARVVRGELVPLADQDRARWRAELITEGVDLITNALRRHPLGRYQVRAAIAAVHDEAPTAAATDWAEILGLYDVLARIDPGPFAELGRIVAVGETSGPDAALAQLEAVPIDAPPGRVAAVRAHLLARAGRGAEARTAYATAASATSNEVERRWLENRASEIATR